MQTGGAVQLAQDVAREVAEFGLLLSGQFFVVALVDVDPGGGVRRRELFEQAVTNRLRQEAVDDGVWEGLGRPVGGAMRLGQLLVVPVIESSHDWTLSWQGVGPGGSSAGPGFVQDHRDSDSSRRTLLQEGLCPSGRE
jgi:hypothetical protein